MSDEQGWWERSAAGVYFETVRHNKVAVPAYDESRPDIDWDEVGKAVLGKTPVSRLRAMIHSWLFGKDPVRKVKACQTVTILYSKSNPKIFFLPDKFRTPNDAGAIRRVGRIILLTILWAFWVVAVTELIGGVLGVQGLMSFGPAK